MRLRAGVSENVVPFQAFFDAHELYFGYGVPLLTRRTQDESRALFEKSLHGKSPRLAAGATIDALDRAVIARANTGDWAVVLTMHRTHLQRSKAGSPEETVSVTSTNNLALQVSVGTIRIVVILTDRVGMPHRLAQSDLSVIVTDADVADLRLRALHNDRRILIENLVVFVDLVDGQPEQKIRKLGSLRQGLRGGREVNGVSYFRPLLLSEVVPEQRTERGIEGVADDEGVHDDLLISNGRSCTAKGVT